MSSLVLGEVPIPIPAAVKCRPILVRRGPILEQERKSLRRVDKLANFHPVEPTSDRCPVRARSSRPPPCALSPKEMAP